MTKENQEVFVFQKLWQSEIERRDEIINCDKQVIADLRAEAAMMESALEAYRDELCEGFCRDWQGEFSPDQSIDCQGCRARNVLLKVKPTPLPLTAEYGKGAEG